MGNWGYSPTCRGPISLNLNLFFGAHLVLNQPTNYFWQKNGDESHGRIHKKSPTKQTKVNGGVSKSEGEQAKSTHQMIS